MRFVVFGDVHFFRLLVWPWQLMSKRLLGQLNVWVNRRSHFRLKLLPAMIQRIEQLAPDMILGTGDFTTIALPAEFAAARSRFAPLFEKFPTFLVPGNHDRYTFSAHRRRRFEEYFQPYTASTWPHHQQLSPTLHLIGLDVAQPNWLYDRGRLGLQQGLKLTNIIASIPEHHRLIVVCHYTLGTPPGMPRESSRHQLIDVRQLIDTLRGPRETLYLHGHVHRPWCWRHPEAPNVVTLNAGAPVMVGKPWPMGQGFWEVEAATDAAAGPGAAAPWRLTRHLADDDGRWKSFSFDPPMAPNGVAELDPPDPQRPAHVPELQ